jgi:DNA processing protein
VERDELQAWLRLTLTPGVGLDSARKLLAAFGLPEQIFGQTAAALRQVVSANQTTALLTEPAGLDDLLTRTWDWLHEARDEGVRAQLITLGDARYPPALLQLDDPPLMLYLLGTGSFAANQAPGLVNANKFATDSIAFDARHSIAVVGSRNPTPQGAANAHDFAKALGQAGVIVVSGMARGVDAAAHEGALDSLPAGAARLATVAVVGTGLDRVYPKSHLELARRISRHGLLVSEYPLGTPPLAANFPRRNRLIAGLAQGTLVVEAALKSGSLITARLAAEQGKEVFAIPGSIHSPQARGCHALIRQGAKLVESAADVLEDMALDLGSGFASNSIAEEPDTARSSGHFDSEDVVLAALGFDPVGLDALAVRCGLDAAQLQTRLMLLELDGQVARLPGGLFQRMDRA